MCSHGSFPCPVKQSSHFVQAHALLNLHIIHSAQASTNGQTTGASNGVSSPQNEHASTHAIHRLSPPTSAMPGSGFRIYSPLTANPHQSPSTLFASNHNGGDEAPEFHADFSAYQLLRVMNRLAQPRTRSLPYFLLCREMGAKAIDGMVKGRILDLRWTEPFSREFLDPFRMSMRVRESIRVQLGRGPDAAGSSGTAVNEPVVAGTTRAESGAAQAEGMEGIGAEGAYGSDEDMVPMSDEEVLRAHERLMDGPPLAGEEDEEVLGPRLVPISPIMRYAMQEVVQEYYADDDRSESEYASLSDADVQEY